MCYRLSWISLCILGMGLLTVSSREAGAGAWTQPAGGFYAKIEGAVTNTDREFDRNGENVHYAVDSLRVRPASYDNRQIRGYLEYGLARRLTSVLSLSWQTIEVEQIAARQKTYGFSDLRVGLRYGLSESELVSAVAVEAKIPTGYDEASFPALGSHTLDIAFMVQAGRSFPGGYATAETGINFRSGELANELPWSFELGLRPFSRAQVRGIVRGRRAFGSLEEKEEKDLARVNARSLDVAGAVVYSVTPRCDVEASLARTVTGKNSLRGTEVALGLAVHR